jgi:hypothetical protein
MELLKAKLKLQDVLIEKFDIMDRLSREGIELQEAIMEQQWHISECKARRLRIDVAMVGFYFAMFDGINRMEELRIAGRQREQFNRVISELKDDMARKEFESRIVREAMLEVMTQCDELEARIDANNVTLERCKTELEEVRVGFNMPTIQDLGTRASYDPEEVVGKLLGQN